MSLKVAILQCSLCNAATVLWVPLQAGNTESQINCITWLHCTMLFFCITLFFNKPPTKCNIFMHTAMEGGAYKHLKLLQVLIKFTLLLPLSSQLFLIQRVTRRLIVIVISLTHFFSSHFRYKSFIDYFYSSLHQFYFFSLCVLFCFVALIHRWLCKNENCVLLVSISGI